MKRGWLHLVIVLGLIGNVSFAGQSSNGVQSVAGDQPGDAPKTPPQRVRVSQGVAEKLCRKKVQPRYPKDARRAGIQGQLVLQLLIKKNGDVESVALVAGPPELAAAAIEAVKRWKYKPYLLNGHPLMMETQVVVNFQLLRN